MRKKFIIFTMIFIFLSLTGCNNKSRNNDKKEEEELLNILVVLTDERARQYYEYVYQDNFDAELEKFEYKYGMRVKIDKMDDLSTNDAKTKLASLVYTNPKYDIVVFHNDEVRNSFERDDVTEKITHIEGYDDIFNSIKNEYFIPLYYEINNTYFAEEELVKLNLDLEDRQKYTFHDILRLMARNLKLRPGKYEMVREAVNLNLNYKLTKEELKIDLNSVKNFRDELREILLSHYNLKAGEREDYVKEKYRDKTNDWRGLRAVYPNRYVLMDVEFFNISESEKALGGDNRDKKTDVYYLKPLKNEFLSLPEEKFGFNAFMAGVLKESKNKEMAFKFLENHLKTEKERIVNNIGTGHSYRSVVSKQNIEFISKKELEIPNIKQERIDLRNKSIQFLDGELGEWIKYEIVTDEYIKEHVMYAIRPYILDDYKEEEVKKRIEAFEKQVNVILAEKQ